MYNSTSVNNNEDLIASLKPYHNKWLIKARVIFKSELKRFQNGYFFNMYLKDRSGEINVTAYKDQCDKFYNFIEEGKVYLVSKGFVKLTKWPTFVKNDYEISLNKDTVIHQHIDDDEEVPEIEFDLMPISEIKETTDDAFVDTIGICHEISELHNFQKSSRRNVTIVDQNNDTISLTLWGQRAVNFGDNLKAVIVVKGSKINNFNNCKSLNISDATILRINPSISEAYVLRDWYDNGGEDSVRNSRINKWPTDWLTLKDADMKRLGSGEKPDYFQCKAIVHFMKTEDFIYKSCKRCSRKIIDESRCEKCNISDPEFHYSYRIFMRIEDWSSNRWVTCFNDVAKQLLKHSASEIAEFYESDPDKVERICSDIIGTSFIFKLKCKDQIYNGEIKNNPIVISIRPIDFKEYNHHLITKLKSIADINGIV